MVRPILLNVNRQRYRRYRLQSPKWIETVIGRALIVSQPSERRRLFEILRHCFREDVYEKPEHFVRYAAAIKSLDVNVAADTAVLSSFNSSCIKSARKLPSRVLASYADLVPSELE